MMTPAPPIPDAAQAPWPAHPAPAGSAPEPAAPKPPAPAATKSESPSIAGGGASARMAMGTKLGVGAAIGSAAIAAALLYVNHGRKR